MTDNLFGEPLAPANSTETSQQAAAIASNSGAFERRRKNALWLIKSAGSAGMTAYEVLDKFNDGTPQTLAINQVTGPINRLAAEGLIVPTDYRRDTGRGGTSRVYVATDAGREASKR